MCVRACREGIVLCNVDEPLWPVEFINEAWEQLTGFSKADLGNGFWSFFKASCRPPDFVANALAQADAPAHSSGGRRQAARLPDHRACGTHARAD